MAVKDSNLKHKTTMRPTQFLLKLQNINQEKLTDLHGVGSVLGKNLIEFIQSKRFEYLMQKFDILEQNNPTQSPNIIEPKTLTTNGKLSGQTICITGSFDISRSNLKQQLEDLGAKTVDNVTKQTTILLAGEDAGSKLDKAKKLNIHIASSIEEILYSQIQ